jgi:hypothetical protein
MANYKCTTVYFHGSADDVISDVGDYLDTLDSTTEVLYGPVMFIGGVGWVTAYVVHTDAT